MKDIIQANYANLDDIANRFLQSSQDIHQMSQRIQKQMEHLLNGGWEGQGAVVYSQEMERDVLPAIQRLFEALLQASQSSLDIKQIIQAAEEEGANPFKHGQYEELAVENSIIFPIPTTLFGGVGNIASHPRSQFNSKWKSWSTEERFEFLQSVYKDLAAQYNLTPIDVKMEDLPDKKFLFLTIQDARGVYRGKDLVIDIDNVKDANGSVALGTLIHETRHQIQRELVEKYRTQGDNVQLPPGVTLDQVKALDNNFKNYISPANDYEGYRKQPIEQDARDFAEDYIEDVLKNRFEVVKVA